jgi:hypothetical protein
MMTQPDPVNDPAACELLKLALSDEIDPLQLICDAISDHGEKAIYAAFDATIGSGDRAESAMLQGDASLDQLLAWKARAKLKWQSSVGDASRGEAILVYFLCIAAGLAHHGHLISSRPQNEVEEHLINLASVIPPRWERLITRSLQHG